MPELTIPQAAAALGVSVDTVRRRIKSGVIRAERNDAGAYIVELPAAPAAQQTPGAQQDHGSQQTQAGEQAMSVEQTPARPRAGAGALGVPPRLSDTREASEGEQRRRISDYLGDLRGLRELLEVERQHSSQLLETVKFQRHQLEQAEAERGTLVTVIETLQQHFGIEQLQRILGDDSWSPERVARPRSIAARRQRGQGDREGGA